MKRLSTLFIVFSLFTGFHAFTQGAKTIKRAEAEYLKGNVKKASSIYLTAHKADTTNELVNFNLAKIYVELSKGKSALKHINLALNAHKKPNQKHFLVKANAFQLTHALDSAILYYKKSDPHNRNKKVISKLLKECNYGKQLLAKPKKYKIRNLKSVNSKYHDLAPKITANGKVLYYTSQKSQTKYPENIYVALERGGTWTNGINVGEPLSTEINDACLGLSPDGQTMYVYKGINGGDIYESQLRGKNWSKPTPMSFNTSARETSISVSPTGKELYFVRQPLNTEGQRVGNSDIYICRKTARNRWSKPIKLNANINTIYDEESPYIHSDGVTMYFSSKGHNSMGGFDIFKSTLVNGSWSKPVNLGFPLNTASDERNFVLEADGKYGYYATEKENGGRGGLDIYHVFMPPGKKPNLALVSGKILDEITGKPIEAKITITDNIKNEVVAEFHSNSVSGEYLVSLPSGKNYALTIEKEGHLFHSENFYLVKTKGYTEEKKNVKLLSLKTGSKIVLKNIFFATGSSQLTSSSNSELKKLVTLLKNNPTVKVQIAGHTDHVGNKEANVTLSTNRAKAVKNYLVSAGISSSRISSKGYGSTSPIASNDTEKGRKLNRRTEFIIVN